MTRAVIFGLDGATYHILDHLIEEGVMPNLQRFMEEGARGPLMSTVPPLTPLAWSSLVTGRSPGNHGITGFFQYDSPTSFALRVVTGRELQAETIWAMVNRYGLRSGTLNFVVHSPPPRIEGYVIPGWVPWKWLKRVSRPPGLIETLQDDIAGFDIRELAMDFEQERKSIAGAVIDDYAEWIDLHIRRDRQWFQILLHQMAHDPCELVGVVFDGVDKLQHLLWPYLDPDLRPANPTGSYEAIRSLCLAYFSQLDGFIGEVLAAAGPECTTYIVSDHGFTGTTDILYINAWLERKGYLVWKPETEIAGEDCPDLEPDFYRLSAFDMAKTRAFALTASSNGINIVVRDAKSPHGVPPQDYFEFRQRLTDALLTECVDPETGEPLVTHVWKREDVFSGPAMNLAPDLTLTLRDHGFFSVRRSHQLVGKRKQPMGTHHPEGVLIARGPAMVRGTRIAPCHLTDIAPTVLYGLNLPIPRDLEGEVVQDIFSPAHRAAHAVRWASPTTSMDNAEQEREQPEEDGDLLDRLKVLGYME